MNLVALDVFIRWAGLSDPSLAVGVLCVCSPSLVAAASLGGGWKVSFLLLLLLVNKEVSD